ncbi:MAG TPA: sigma-70 family RNA polymerase sigma factor [Thermoanaerobaculia bacterium]|jgi:RNA polymerase sigma-70 factor (ECF subfamily)
MDNERSAELVARIAAGDRAAEEELARRYIGPLTIQLGRLTRGDGSAADLAQDALLIAIVRLRRRPLSDPQGVGGYVRGIAVHLVMNERRKRARRRTDDGVDAHVPDNSPDALASLLTRERWQLIGESIARLPAQRDRDLLRRFYVDEEPKESIAADFGLTTLHFHRVLFRARERLKNFLPACLR